MNKEPTSPVNQNLYFPVSTVAPAHEKYTFILFNNSKTTGAGCTGLGGLYQATGDGNFQ